MRALALVLLTACATTTTTTTTTTTGPGAGLVGAWRAPAPHKMAGACPFDVEVFSDATVELNYIDDDSERELCMFARVPLRHVSPDVVAFGDVATCRYERRGDKLALACEDRRTPPATLDDALLFEWRSVHERKGLAALRGRYQAAAIAGDAMTLVIDDKGHGTFAGETVEILEAHDDGTARMKVGGAVSACFYRLTDERLTFRCARPGEAPPLDFGDCKDTIVLVRTPY